MDGPISCFPDRRFMASLRRSFSTTIPLYAFLSIDFSCFLISPSNLVIEAEVRYAVRHEYALTAVDVIARRCRLSFLNAQAALDALPRVVEIMSEELHWNRARKQSELVGATKFLQSMGLSPNVVPPTLHEPAGLLDKIGGALHLGSTAERSRARHVSGSYSRAQFEPGEVDELHKAFVVRAQQVDSAPDAEQVLEKDALKELIATLPGYESIRPKDFDYVLEETGFANKKRVGFDEFVEVSSLLRFLRERRQLSLGHHRFVQG